MKMKRSKQHAGVARIFLRGLVLGGVFLLGSQGAFAAAPFCVFTGAWHGQRVCLRNVTNVTVEGLPGAKRVGQITNFQAFEPHTARPPFYCLNGKSINVWKAPRFDSKLVAHNGDQGPQCTYGTWIITRIRP